VILLRYFQSHGDSPAGEDIAVKQLDDIFQPPKLPLKTGWQTFSQSKTTRQILLFQIVMFSKSQIC
jgi:hypothetical protein